MGQDEKHGGDDSSIQTPSHDSRGTPDLSPWLVHCLCPHIGCMARRSLKPKEDLTTPCLASPFQVGVLRQVIFKT
jgi:hypothetical protein